MASVLARLTERLDVDRHERRHVLTIGSTQSGKTTCAVKEAVQLIDEGQCAVVILSPKPHDLATKVFGHCTRLRRPVLFDRLDATDKVLGLTLLRSSDDPVERECLIGAFGDIITRTRGIDLATAPLIRQWTENWIGLVLSQKDPVHPSDLLHAFYPTHPSWAKAILNCSDPEIQWKFAYLPNAGQTLEREVGPAHRLLEQSIGSAVVRMRESLDDWLPAFLEAKGVLLYEGGGVSNLATRTVMSCVLIRVLLCAREYYAKTGRPLRVVIFADEAANFQTIGLYELVIGLNQSLAFGVEFRIISQTLFNDPFLDEGVLQAVQELRAFRCNAATVARTMGENLGLPILDSMRIHHIEERFRQVHDGYETVDFEDASTSSRIDPRTGRPTTTTGKRTGTRDRARFVQIVDELPHYMALSDQLLLTSSVVTNQQRGECVVRNSQGVFRGHVTPLEEPWIYPALTQKKADELLSRIKQLPCYQTPRSVSSDATFSGDISAYIQARLGRLNGSSKSKQNGKATKPSGSPVARLLGDGSKKNGNGRGQQ